MSKAPQKVVDDIKAKEQKAKIDGNRIIEYYSTVELTFSVDSNRE